MHKDALFCFLTLKLIAKKIIFENKQHQFGCKYYFTLVTQINDFIKVSVLYTTLLYERVEGTLTNSRGMMLFDENYSLIKIFDVIWRTHKSTLILFLSNKPQKIKIGKNFVAPSSTVSHNTCRSSAPPPPQRHSRRSKSQFVLHAQLLVCS